MEEANCQKVQRMCRQGTRKGKDEALATTPEFSKGKNGKGGSGGKKNVTCWNCEKGHFKNKYQKPAKSKDSKENSLAKGNTSTVNTAKSDLEGEGLGPYGTWTMTINLILYYPQIPILMRLSAFQLSTHLVKIWTGSLRLLRMDVRQMMKIGFLRTRMSPKMSSWLPMRLSLVQMVSELSFMILVAPNTSLQIAINLRSSRISHQKPSVLLTNRVSVL